MRFVRLAHRLLACLLLLLIPVGCASTSPNLKVLGVADGAPSVSRQENLVVFVEIVNPTARELTVSRLEYRLDADSWFQADGELALARNIGPQSSAIVEVPVRLQRLVNRDASASETAGAPINYSLQGRLFALTERVQRSWPIAVEGVLSPKAVANARHARPIQLRIADSEQ